MSFEESLVVVSRAAPTGREARLWRVVVELAVQVDEAIAAHAEEKRAEEKRADGRRAEEARARAGRADGTRTSRAVGRAASLPSLVGARPRLLPGRLENLVVEFDDAYTVFVEGLERLPSEAQMLALQAMDRQLEAMVRARDAALWTERALREDPRWGDAQRLAIAVIEVFAWPERRLALVG